MRPLRPSSPATRVVLAVFGIVWLVLLIPGFIAGFHSENSFSVLMLQIPFLIIGLGLLGWALVPVAARTRIATPEVLVSNDTPRLGEEITLSYRQAVRSGLLVERMTVELVFTETARSGDGKNSSTRTHERVIRRFDEPGRDYRAGETLDRAYTLTVPADGMHTFITSHNKLQWCVRVRVYIPGWPDFRETYELKVLPEKVG